MKIGTSDRSDIV